jgi:NSS family neurotransmitter:Na+ symporter
MNKTKESWGSRIGLILAMAGNAVGLGNFLRFPVQAIQNGGGTFIIPYLVCFFLMGIPLLWIEWTMGRFGGMKGHHSSPFILAEMGKRWYWKYIGVLGIFSTTAVAAYYCYIESWTMSYLYHSLAGTFHSMSSNEIANFFNTYVSLEKSTSRIPFEPIIFFLLCIVLNIYILSRGLSAGVEMTSKIGMPLLILFGIFLAYKGFTIKAGEDKAIFDGTAGLNFLWTPQFDSLWNPKVWLNAAGQIFFTLAVGMGSIQCYASYISTKDDIVLNAMSAGWMNEFVEILLGGAILIPVSVGYLGIDKVVELTQSGGFGLGFKTLPYLFNQWGPVLATIAGGMWFALLFFAGITSSLAMGTPWMALMEDEFNWTRSKSAWSFGVIILVLGLPTVLFFEEGILDEYDYWAGTVSLFVFSLTEAVLFAWVYGMDKGWDEIHKGADMKIPYFYKYIIQYITPTFLLLILLFNIFTPKGGDISYAFSHLFSEGWSLDNSSIIHQLMNTGLLEKIENTSDRTEKIFLQDKLIYVNGARLLLFLTFVGLSVLVWRAGKKKKYVA